MSSNSTSDFPKDFVAPQVTPRKGLAATAADSLRRNDPWQRTQSQGRGNMGKVHETPGDYHGLPGDYHWLIVVSSDS